MQSMRARLWSAATLCLVASTALSADAPATVDDSDFELLQRFLDDVSTLNARFEQSLVDASDTVVESSGGTVSIRRPGQFRWHYTEPYEQILVADGTNLWSYDVDLEQVTVKPQADVLENTPAMLLGGDATVLEQFQVTASEHDPRGTVWLTLKPHHRDAGFERIDLGFDDGVLRRMLFTDNLEQTTLIALLDIQLNAEAVAADFEFTPPDGVDLVGEPLSVDGR